VGLSKVAWDWWNFCGLILGQAQGLVGFCVQGLVEFYFLGLCVKVRVRFFFFFFFLVLLPYRRDDHPFLLVDQWGSRGPGKYRLDWTAQPSMEAELKAWTLASLMSGGWP
jgi:hypothetical protein